jgi:hypothetical protein
MIPAIKKEDVLTYVSEGAIVRFISENAPMDWNKCCDFIREQGISGDEGRIMWTKPQIEKYPKQYNPEAVKWILAFFEAHPFVGDKIMICFDD